MHSDLTDAEAGSEDVLCPRLACECFDAGIQKVVIHIPCLQRI